MCPRASTTNSSSTDYSPKRAAVVDYYSRLAPDRLTWRVISNVGSKQVNKAVLRNRLKRRWASAFTEALKEDGYYHNGRKRSGPKDGTKYTIGLRGTLEILVFSDRGISCPHSELVHASRAVLKAVMRKAQQEQVGSGSSKETSMQDEGQSKAESDVSSSLWSSWQNLL